jgi:hypothetical protein
MRLKFVIAALLISPVPFEEAALAQPTVVCGYGQTCQNGNPAVPFPVINPLQGLNNVLTYTLGKDQPPSPPPTWGYAPIATPPPVLPPSSAP